MPVNHWYCYHIQSQQFGGLRGSLYHIDGLVKDYSNPIANALESLWSCTKPAIYIYIYIYIYWYSHVFLSMLSATSGSLQTLLRTDMKPWFPSPGGLTPNMRRLGETPSCCLGSAIISMKFSIQQHYTKSTLACFNSRCPDVEYILEENSSLNALKPPTERRTLWWRLNPCDNSALSIRLVLSS